MHCCHEEVSVSLSVISAIILSIFKQQSPLTHLTPEADISYNSPPCAKNQRQTQQTLYKRGLILDTSAVFGCQVFASQQASDWPRVKLRGGMWCWLTALWLEGERAQAAQCAADWGGGQVGSTNMSVCTKLGFVFDTCTKAGPFSCAFNS